MPVFLDCRNYKLAFFFFFALILLLTPHQIEWVALNTEGTDEFHSMYRHHFNRAYFHGMKIVCLFAVSKLLDGNIFSLTMYLFLFNPQQRFGSVRLTLDVTTLCSDVSNHH